MIVLVDVDGVLGDFVGAVIREVRKKFPDVADPDQIRSGWILDHMNKKEAQYARDVIEDRNFAITMPLVEGAHNGIELIREAGHDVYAVTAPWVEAPTWCYDRFIWLQNHFGIPSDKVVYTKAKYLVGGDVLIEDMQSTLKTWQSHFPAGVCVWHHEREPSAFKWKDIVELPWANVDELRVGVLNRSLTGAA